ncbi:MAG: M24 family metallopeptidase [Chloroflexota bacterium]
MITLPPPFAQRQEALRATMQAEGLSAIVIFGQLSRSALGTGTSGYLRYLVGWSARFLPSLLVLTLNEPPILVTPSPQEAARARETFPSVGRCLVEFPAGYGRLARQILDKLRAKRVGLVGLSEMPLPVHQGLTQGRDPVAFSPADRLIDELRVTKDEGEIELMREAARISAHMLTCLAEQLRSFRGPAWKLAVEMEYAGRSRGAEQAMCWLAIGQPADRQCFQLEELQRPVRDGDSVLVGTYVTYQGYWGHCLRMGSIGEPSLQYWSLYEAALAQHRASAAQIRVGEDARKVHAEAVRVAEKRLPGSSDHPARFQYAHFLGLDYAEYPTRLCFPHANQSLAGGAESPQEMPLRPGMVLENHPSLGLPGIGFGVIGDMYLVRPGEPERLTLFPQELFVVCAGPPSHRGTFVAEGERRTDSTTK